MKVVMNVVDHQIQNVHIVILTSCMLDHVYTHVLLELGITQKIEIVILVTLHVTHVTMMKSLVVILVPLQDTMMQLPVNVN